MSSSAESDSDNTLNSSSLPRKSKHKYIHAYEYFMRWKNKRNEENLDEDVFLAYFTELSKVKKPSTLWSQYSMLKATMLPKHGVDMKNFEKLLSYLKKFTIGFKSEKSKVLTEDDVLKFVNEAPDDIYLVVKVALIIGVGGACKIYELTDLTVNDINMHGDLMLVRIPQPKKDRTFIVRDEFVPIVKKYQALRPKKMPTKRFFINYRAGACTRQVIGRNKLSSFPKQIASYLKLPDPGRYTGMCFKASWLSYGTSLMTIEKQKFDSEEAKKDEVSVMTAEKQKLVSEGAKYKRDEMNLMTVVQQKLVSEGAKNKRDEISLMTVEKQQVVSEGAKRDEFNLITAEKRKFSSEGAKNDRDEINLMTAVKRKLSSEGAKNDKDEINLLKTKSIREDHSYVDFEGTNGVDIKIEEMDTFEEEILLTDNLAEEVFTDDFQIPISGGLSSDVTDISEDMYEDTDTVHIKDEEGDRIINLSPLREESQSENTMRETNIDVAGNNIKIYFRNCAHITVNIYKK